MSEALIIEEAGNLKLERVATVQTKRDEFLVNIDLLVCAFAEIRSERNHEERMGWSLSDAWYREAFGRLVAAANTRAVPQETPDA